MIWKKGTIDDGWNKKSEGYKSLILNVVEVRYVRTVATIRRQMVFLIAGNSTNHPDVFDDVFAFGTTIKILEFRISVNKIL
jgi:hypothetical protein